MLQARIEPERPMGHRVSNQNRRKLSKSRFVKTHLPLLCEKQIVAKYSCLPKIELVHQIRLPQCEASNIIECIFFDKYAFHVIAIHGVNTKLWGSYSQ